MRMMRVRWWVVAAILYLLSRWMRHETLSIILSFLSYPRMVFDMHLSSLRSANVKTLWEDDVHPHYVMRRYVEFTASLIHLNVDYGDGQLEMNSERLLMAVDNLIMKLSTQFRKSKLQSVFLINNYDMTISVLKEAGLDGGKIQMHFEDVLKSQTSIFVIVEFIAVLVKVVKAGNQDADMEFIFHFILT
ncbi:vacuolar protein sorting-associated protein 52 A-like [Silene latifolia]|uniref:vacuolar protein sorting-associated protein 52 A-like n=1 Tax=Silene latifolia TaxID=37657 RepID=UPI003D77DD06